MGSFVIFTRVRFDIYSFMLFYIAKLDQCGDYVMQSDGNSVACSQTNQNTYFCYTKPYTSSTLILLCWQFMPNILIKWNQQIGLLHDGDYAITLTPPPIPPSSNLPLLPVKHLFEEWLTAQWGCCCWQYQWCGSAVGSCPRCGAVIERRWLPCGHDPWPRRVQPRTSAEQREAGRSEPIKHLSSLIPPILMSRFRYWLICSGDDNCVWQHCDTGTARHREIGIIG